MPRKVLTAALALVALAVLAVIAVPLLVVVALLGAASGAQACTGQPATPPGAPGGAWAWQVNAADLSPTQLENAATIVAVGQEMAVPTQGLVVALATAAQESGFRNLANDGVVQYDSQGRPDLTVEQRGVDRSLQMPHDGVGTDHGSVNAFQHQYPVVGFPRRFDGPADRGPDLLHGAARRSGLGGDDGHRRRPAGATLRGGIGLRRRRGAGPPTDGEPDQHQHQHQYEHEQVRQALRETLYVQFKIRDNDVFEKALRYVREYY